MNLGSHNSLHSHLQQANPQQQQQQQQHGAAQQGLAQRSASVADIDMQPTETAGDGVLAPIALQVGGRGCWVRACLRKSECASEQEGLGGWGIDAISPAGLITCMTSGKQGGCPCLWGVAGELGGCVWPTAGAGVGGWGERRSWG